MRLFLNNNVRDKKKRSKKQKYRNKKKLYFSYILRPKFR